MAAKTLQGKLAIVTGAGKANGVGFAVAKLLAEQGADIVIHYNSSKGPAEENVKALEALGAKAIAVQANAASVDYGKAIIDATLAAFGSERKIDIIVNNAGTIAAFPSLSAFTPEAFDDVFHVNVRSILLLIQAAEPHLAVSTEADQSSGARIINIGSIAGRIGIAPANLYGGSKAALHSMTRGWAEELGPRGITVNVALLGPIETDMVFPEDNPYTKMFRTNQFIKRNGSTSEAAGAIVFLASPASSFVTGQVLNIDGGLTYA
ncbi:hypothetical protein BX600DRAFT_59163 [Xylariales sp. PMI_506]|nr:hypothetical protein BX600DRAFT_59163 [Xylariales sp. PMI_506]